MSENTAAGQKANRKTEQFPQSEWKLQTEEQWIIKLWW